MITTADVKHFRVGRTGGHWNGSSALHRLLRVDDPPWFVFCLVKGVVKV